jgi:hypothetical protein
MSHVDLDQVADLDGGVLSPEQERVVRGHLETCHECSPMLERVREVHDRLAAEPAPPLPATVAARLDDSLAATAREREARTGVASLKPAKSRRRSWAPRLLAAAVALATVGGGAYVAQDVLGSNAGGGSPTNSDAAAVPTAQGGAAGPAESNGRILDLSLRDHHLKSQLRTAFTDKKEFLDSVVDGSTAVPARLERIAPDCVSSALGAQKPGNWVSYGVTFDSRPAVLVLSRAGIANLKVWVVECQPAPTVSASTIVPNP